MKYGLIIGGLIGFSLGAWIATNSRETRNKVCEAQNAITCKMNEIKEQIKEKKQDQQQTMPDNSGSQTESSYN